MKFGKIPKTLFLLLIIAIVSISVVILFQVDLWAIIPNLPLFQKEKAPLRIEFIELKEPQMIAQTTTPTTTLDTSKWKTYINEKLGYKFKYPENWSVIEQPGGYVVTIAGPRYDPKSGLYRDEITLYVDPKYLNPYGTPAEEVKESKINIAGREGTEFLLINYLEPFKGTVKWVVIKKDTSFYKFVVDMDDHPAAEIFDQMIKTFEFIE